MDLAGRRLGLSSVTAGAVGEATWGLASSGGRGWGLTPKYLGWSQSGSPPLAGMTHLFLGEVGPLPSVSLPLVSVLAVLASCLPRCSAHLTSSLNVPALSFVHRPSVHQPIFIEYPRSAAPHAGYRATKTNKAAFPLGVPGSYKQEVTTEADKQPWGAGEEGNGGEGEGGTGAWRSEMQTSGQGWAGSRRGMDPGQSGVGEWGRKLVLWAEASACAKALELGSRRCSRNDFREGQHLSRIYCVWAPSYDPYSSLLNPYRHTRQSTGLPCSHVEMS